MKATIAIVSVILMLLLIGPAQAQSAGIFGVYGQCIMACRYIKINPDFTFEEILDGDLFNGQRKSGGWKYLGNAKIKAESPKPNPALKVRESESSDKGTTVNVVDAAGAAVARAKISGNASGMDFKCTTNEDGDCEIPKTTGFELEWEGFKGKYAVKNLAANRFQVELTHDQMDTVIDEIWLIKGNQLFVEYEGAIDKTFSLKRIPTNRARKLFPQAKSK